VTSSNLRRRVVLGHNNGLKLGYKQVPYGLLPTLLLAPNPDLPHFGVGDPR
jgi:hypothetical protein